MLLRHILKRDFFNFAVNARLWMILIALVSAYSLMITVWAHVYFSAWW